MDTDRLQSKIDGIETRVEILREQALSIQKERESLLELLQNLQDNTDLTKLQDVDREDFDIQLERLILRCLTVDVAIATPRNENQEESFKIVTEMIGNIKSEMKKLPFETEKCVESYLNASLPEPLSGNINLRFQEKLLGCTADDQKGFRKKLQKLYSEVKKLTGTLTNSDINSDTDSTDTQGPESPIKEA